MILNWQKMIHQVKNALFLLTKVQTSKLKGKLIKIDMQLTLVYIFFHKLKKNKKNNKGPKQVIKKYIGLIK
jgi:hypothetical protein